MSKAEKPVETVEKVIERPYTLRKLKDSDLFPLVKLLRSIGLKEIKKVIEDVQGADGKSFDEIGKGVVFEMADVVISNIENHENEIYSFWSELSGIPVDDMKEMEFGTLPLMIYDSFLEVKNTTFFKVLFKLL